jgi:GT2 family glycosyltransferase
LAPSDWLAKHYFLDARTSRGPVECAMVQGACFAFRKVWSDRVGGFDADRFFLYWEETDFCRRVMAVGGKVLFCPQLICRHRGGVSMPNGKQDIRHFWRSFYAYHRKHDGVLKTGLLRLLLSSGMAAEYLLLTGLRHWRRDADSVLVSDHEELGARLREQLRF